MAPPSWVKEGNFSILSPPRLNPLGSDEVSADIAEGVVSWRDLRKLELRCVGLAEIDRLLLLFAGGDVAESVESLS